MNNRDSTKEAAKLLEIFTDLKNEAIEARSRGDNDGARDLWRRSGTAEAEFRAYVATWGEDWQ